MDTPELDKMLAVKNDSQKIGEFLSWLDEQEIVLAEWSGSNCDECDEEILMTATMNKEQILAKFFDIDLDKCEKERQQILADLQKQNKD